jgi:DNA-binding NarL/FixJ family response regulator
MGRADTKRISVVVADYHRMVAQSVAALLRQKFDVVGIATDGRALVSIARIYRPDVIVTGITMPRLNGIDATRLLVKALSDVKILILTMQDDVSMAEAALAAGAKGFMLKACTGAELISAIEAVARGEMYVTPAISQGLASTLPVGSDDFHTGKLTPRHREVLECIAEGKTMKEAAAVLDISPRTAECHKYEIMRRLGANTTAELVRYAIRRGLI